MMKEEFEQIAGYEVSFEDYRNIIEPMYMATNLSKAEFAKVINKKAFALPTKQAIMKEMREKAAYIAENKFYRDVYDEEVELEEMAKMYAKRFYNLDWSHDLKVYVYFNSDNIMDNLPNELVIGRGQHIYERIRLI